MLCIPCSYMYISLTKYKTPNYTKRLGVGCTSFAHIVSVQWLIQVCQWHREILCGFKSGPVIFLLMKIKFNAATVTVWILHLTKRYIFQKILKRYYQFLDFSEKNILLLVQIKKLLEFKMLIKFQPIIHN